MKVILEIGYEKYLLPNDKGIAAIVAALSRARKVRVDHSGSWNYKKDRYCEVYCETPSVAVTMVADVVPIRIHKEAE